MLPSRDAIFLGFLAFLIWETVCFKEKKSVKFNIVCSLFIFYVSLIIALTIFPIPYAHFNSDYDYKYNFIPFSSIIGALGCGSITAMARQLLGNIIMFMPFGFLFPFVFRGIKKRQLNTLLAGVAFSLSIEAVQAIIGAAISYRYRVVDVDDIILNFAGLVLGCVIFKLCPKKIKLLFED